MKALEALGFNPDHVSTALAKNRGDKPDLRERHYDANIGVYCNFVLDEAMNG